ncbi:MAG: ABC transporter permease, partial [Acidimicrobiia bacterium]
MTTIAIPRLGGRWIVEYARRPLNVALLIVVPIVFVTLSAGALADFADILAGDGATAGEVEAATAAWAAAVLAGVAAFFHVSQSRDADRRLAAAGLGAARVVASRLVSTLVLALTAS